MADSEFRIIARSRELSQERFHYYWGMCTLRARVVKSERMLIITMHPVQYGTTNGGLRYTSDRVFFSISPPLPLYTLIQNEIPLPVASNLKGFSAAIAPEKRIEVGLDSEERELVRKAINGQCVLCVAPLLKPTQQTRSSPDSERRKSKMEKKVSAECSASSVGLASRATWSKLRL